MKVHLILTATYAAIALGIGVFALAPNGHAETLPVQPVPNAGGAILGTEIPDDAAQRVHDMEGEFLFNTPPAFITGLS
ncbi:hypothetical protein FHX08_005548 [Rhizobium sp. BK529]|uniref:hypothetical protein n=1 Tax=Rhizobium sp. BK529 TaxID=2586983 RepID=UPI0018339400|nr:hypothetical protein [Rhizobium sp. BK529]MBB3595138.1 hypothetical protein [Rhizobium sp. BK529]